MGVRICGLQALAKGADDMEKLLSGPGPGLSVLFGCKRGSQVEDIPRLFVGLSSSRLPGRLAFLLGASKRVQLPVEQGRRVRRLEKDQPEGTDSEPRHYTERWSSVLLPM